MLSIVLALVLPLFFLDWFRILRQIPLWLYWRTELVLLIGIEAAYGVALLAAGFGFPVLALLCLGGRRRGQPRPLAARLLLCAASVLIGLLAAEAVVFVRDRPGVRMPVLPVAAPALDVRASTTGRLPLASEKVALRQKFPEGAEGGGIDLVVLGESSAEGVPFQRWLSVGALVKWQLEEAIPGLGVRLTILARSGDTLEKQHEALAGLKRRPEILIVYCGHNEFLSRFFAFSDLPYYFIDQRPSGWGRFVLGAERFSPLCGLIRQSADRCRIALPPPPLQRDLVDVPVFTPDEYSRILLDFRRRLEEIVSYASSLGALPILISPPGNDADFEPNRSFLPAGTALRERESFRRAFLEARRLEGVDRVTSMKRYRDLAARAHPASPKRTIGWQRCCGRPASGAKRTGTSFLPETWTDIRCAVSPLSRRFTARWPHGMTAFTSTGSLTFTRSAATACWTTSSSRMRCIPRCAGRSRWRKRSCTRFRYGERSGGRRICLPGSSIRPSAQRISVWEARPGNTPLGGKAVFTAWSEGCGTTRASEAGGSTPPGSPQIRS